MVGKHVCMYCMYECMFECVFCVCMRMTLCPTSWQERPAGSGEALDPRVSITDWDWQTSLLVLLSHSPTLSLSGLHSATLSGWLSFTLFSCLCAPPPPFLFFFLSHNPCKYIRMLFSVCHSSTLLSLSLSICLSLSPSLLSSFSLTDGCLKPFLALLSECMSLFCVSCFPPQNIMRPIMHAHTFTMFVSWTALCVNMTLLF